MPQFTQLAAKPSRGPRVGVVTSISAEGVCMVLVAEGEVPAYLTDQVWDAVAIGAVVTLLPVGDTYEVISTRTGTTGGGGLTLGPELLPNSGFEFGTDMPTGWAAYPWLEGNYTVGRDTTPGEATSGSARLLVTLSPGDDDPVVRNYNLSAVAVDAGRSYQCSVWVKAPAGDPSLTVELSAATAPLAVNAGLFGTGSTLHPVALVADPGGAYQLMTGFFTVPTGDKWARVYLSAVADSTTAPVTVSWDESSLRQRITS